jgi:hypothetical protein
MIDAGRIREIFSRYRLDSAVSREDRKRILRSRRRLLRKIMAGGKISPLVPLALGFYHAFRRAGFSFSLSAGYRSAVFSMGLASAAIALVPVFFLSDYIPRSGKIALEAPSLKGRVSGVSGKALLKRDGAARELSLQDEVLPGDEIITGESSQLVFGYSGGYTVRLSEKSSLRVDGSGGTISLMLKSGGVISGVPVLAEGRGYRISSPDSLVSVKGTVFGVTHVGGRTRVFVSQGLVSVRHLPSGAEYSLGPGLATDVGGDMSLRPMSDEERTLLEAFVKSSSAGSPGTGSLNKAESSDSVLKENTSGNLTLQELKDKYGRIDEVTLYNGKKIRGVILGRGEIFRIITDRGMTAVNAREIRGTEILK